VTERYELRVYSPARRALEEHLPVAVGLAVWEFCDGPLRQEPRRVGRPLGRELAGYFSARRGAYRVIYRVDDDARTVHVVRIEHPADVYRRR
jgi:mRNA interferase RelE/StbE